jgi:hypothetical protein
MKCAFIPTSGKVPGAAACCKGKDCAVRISCVEKGDMGDCDKACQADAMTLKWYVAVIIWCASRSGTDNN